MNSVLNVTDDWRIESDGEMNWVIMRRIECKPKKDGTPPKDPFRWAVDGYYGSIQAACVAMHKKLLHRSDYDGSLEGVDDAIREATRTIVEAVRHARD